MTALSPADLAAYRRRIGWDGPARADRATLGAIVAAHAASIAFENLDPLLGRPVSIALGDIVAKLVHARRGGYCFEQNGLLEAALGTLGFATTGYAARVMWRVPDDVINARTHKILRVELDDGPVIVDVGLGGQVLTGVLNLVPDTAQDTPHGPYRLVRDGTLWRQEALVHGIWRPTYAFDEQPQQPIDYELANWYTAASPRSHFRTTLIAGRHPPGRRVTLRNFELTVRRDGLAAERCTLADADALCDTLEGEFGIALPDRAALIARIDAGLA